MDLKTLLLGRLDGNALKHDWIELLAGVSVVMGLLSILALITYKKAWKYLWKEWFTSVDHKKIGIMYIIGAIVMFVKGLIDAMMMRSQLALSSGDSFGYLGAEHYQQIVAAHGATMIFFVAMGLVFGLINLVMPLQIGARDVAFPFLNSLSFWLYVAGSLYIIVSLCIGHYTGAGWSNYTPLSGLAYDSGTGSDYWCWSTQIAGAGSMLGGINFLVTILKMRCPGMKLNRMPIFVWASLVTSVLVIFAFPILTGVVGMLSTDRLLDTKIFTATHGGSPMMYINLFWAWGHPEVYILILPIFGVFSEIVPVFSRKTLFGYISMVWALVAICFLSFIVWLHHFYTMGAGANVNAFFGIMTAIVAIPTGVKVFNWIFTMYRGRVKFTTPMLWFMGFIFQFVTGGMAGVMLSIPAVDFQLHNSLFLVAHFHSVMVGGMLFGFFAAYSYWFPKFTGFKLDEKLGKIAFYFWFVGFIVAFFPLYLLGFMGATRRLNHYAASTGWQPLFIVTLIGALLILTGVGFQGLQLLVSIKNKKKNIAARDPWNGRTLEWSTTSPPPFYNFAITPEVHSKDAYWHLKNSKEDKVENHSYNPIHMPKNTGIGFLVGVFAFIAGFGLIFHMFLLAAIAVAAIMVSLFVRFFQKETEYYVEVSEIERIELNRELK